MQKVYPIPSPKVDQLEGDDRSLVAYLLAHEPDVTEQFLYGEKSWNFFRAIKRYWQTTYESEIDAADDAYVHIHKPRESDGTTPIQRFSFRVKFFAWFFFVSKNYCIDKWRHHRKLKFCPIEEMESVADEDSSIAVIYNAQVVENVFNNMPHKRYVEALKYRYLNNMSIEQIAIVMHDSRANISRIIYNAHMQFEDILMRIYPNFYRERNKKEKKSNE